MATTSPTPPCPEAWQHTPAPRDYLAWHMWAEQMGRTDGPNPQPAPLQRLRAVQDLDPAPRRPRPTPIEYRLMHKECQCRDGEALGCECRWCRHNQRSLDRMTPTAPKEQQ